MMMEAAGSPRVDLTTPNLQEMVSREGHAWSWLAMRRRSWPQRAATEEGRRGECKGKGVHANKQTSNTFLSFPFFSFSPLRAYAECLWPCEDTLSTVRTGIFQWRTVRLNAQSIHLLMLSPALFRPLVRFSFAFVIEVPCCVSSYERTRIFTDTITSGDIPKQSRKRGRKKKALHASDNEFGRSLATPFTRLTPLPRRLPVQPHRDDAPGAQEAAQHALAAFPKVRHLLWHCAHALRLPGHSGGLLPPQVRASLGGVPTQRARPYQSAE